VRDNDRAYGHVFTSRVRAMGIRDRPISPGSPWQDGCAERLIGTLRREYLDQVMIFGEMHLRRILSAYAADMFSVGIDVWFVPTTELRDRFAFASSMSHVELIFGTAGQCTYVNGGTYGHRRYNRNPGYRRGSGLACKAFGRAFAGGRRGVCLPPNTGHLGGCIG
jgi:transposase InsO family protein